MDKNTLNVYKSLNDNVGFYTLAEKSLSGILIVSRTSIHYINKAFEDITGYNKSDISQMAPWDMVHPDERKKIRALGLARLAKRNMQNYYEALWIHKSERKIWVEVRAVLLENTTPPKILANIIDISDRKKATMELTKREKDLEIQSKKLEETITAINVILRQKHDESEKLKKDIQFNIEKLVFPYIDELAGSLTKPRFKSFLRTIKENLKEITDPYIREISSQYEKLTPKQIQVINLVRQRKTSKEIAEILGVSKAAIDFHRNNVRKKLFLNRKKVNLQTYLDMNESELNGLDDNQEVTTVREGRILKK